MVETGEAERDWMVRGCGVVIDGVTWENWGGKFRTESTSKPGAGGESH